LIENKIEEGVRYFFAVFSMLSLYKIATSGGQVDPPSSSVGSGLSSEKKRSVRPWTQIGKSNSVRRFGLGIIGF